MANLTFKTILFEATPLVYIEVVNSKSNSGCRDDEVFIQGFLCSLSNYGIPIAVSIERKYGSFCGFFTAENAEKVASWLRKYIK